MDSGAGVRLAEAATLAEGRTWRFDRRLGTIADPSRSRKISMSYQVLARKWRPRSFAEMVGQEHVVRALVNALDQDRVHHAFLFAGTRGVGKTTVARVFAKALNCESGVSSQPCGTCSACTDIDEGRFLDLIEVDAASRTKVDDTRDLMENVQYAPARGRFKVYLIDEVHMLSTHSFNALLKTLEEPPPHVKFLLATTDPQKLPVTVLSRCLQFNLKRLPVALIDEYLAKMLGQEEVEAEAEGIHLLAVAADGSMRDALSLLDQGIAYGGGRLLADDVRAMLGTVERRHLGELIGSLCAGDAQALWDSVEALADHAPDYSRILGEIAQLLHSAAIAQVVADAPGDDPLVAELAQRLNPEDVQLYYQIALGGRGELDLAPDHRTGFEMTLLRMLAFRPATVESAETKPPEPGRTVAEPAAPASKPSAVESKVPSGAAAAPPRRESVLKPVPPGEKTGAAEAREDPPPAPVTEVRTDPDAALAAEESTVPDPAPATELAGRETSEWATLIDRLGLNGTAAVLAQNSIFKRRGEGRYTLVLDPKLEHLHTPAAERKIAAALTKFYGKGAEVSFTRGRPDAESPARARDRQAEQRLREASEALENDPAVQALRSEFGAELIADSIVPAADEGSEAETRGDRS